MPGISRQEFVNPSPPEPCPHPLRQPIILHDARLQRGPLLVERLVTSSATAENFNISENAGIVGSSIGERIEIVKENVGIDPGD
jgi:hypothetical protein